MRDILDKKSIPVAHPSRCEGAIYVGSRKAGLRASAHVTVNSFDNTIETVSTCGLEPRFAGPLGSFFPMPRPPLRNRRLNRRAVNLRVWMLRHVAMGYSVHMQRLFGYLTWWALPLFMPSEYIDLTPEGANLRSDVFTACECDSASLTDRRR